MTTPRVKCLHRCKRFQKDSALYRRGYRYFCVDCGALLKIASGIVLDEVAKDHKYVVHERRRT